MTLLYFEMVVIIVHHHQPYESDYQIVIAWAYRQMVYKYMIQLIQIISYHRWGPLGWKLRFWRLQVDFIIMQHHLILKIKVPQLIIMLLRIMFQHYYYFMKPFEPSLSHYPFSQFYYLPFIEGLQLQLLWLHLILYQLLFVI